MYASLLKRKNEKEEITTLEMAPEGWGRESKGKYRGKNYYR